MVVIALDPGPEQTALVALRPDGRPFESTIGRNAYIAELLDLIAADPSLGAPVLAVEMIASYGMPVGADVFETCVWIGRFVERWGGEHALVYRRDVKLHLCDSPRAKDANIRQALIDRFGPSKQAAIGTKKAPGPLYGFKSHLWAALAVAVTYHDRTEAQRRAA
jgi:hypothetical protein